MGGVRIISGQSTAADVARHRAKREARGESRIETWLSAANRNRLVLHVRRQGFCSMSDAVADLIERGLAAAENESRGQQELPLQPKNAPAARSIEGESEGRVMYG